MPIGLTLVSRYRELFVRNRARFNYVPAGQERHFPSYLGMSASPPRADIRAVSRSVCYVPGAVIPAFPLCTGLQASGQCLVGSDMAWQRANMHSIRQAGRRDRPACRFWPREETL